MLVQFNGEKKDLIPWVAEYLLEKGLALRVEIPKDEQKNTVEKAVKTSSTPKKPVKKPIKNNKNKKVK